MGRRCEQILAVFDRPTPHAPTKLLRTTLVGLGVLLGAVAAAIALFLLVRAFS